MKRTILLTLVIFLIASATPALATGGTGQIRIQPALPTMVTSPANFNISVTTGVSYAPHLLLVMTNASYQGLTGNIVVTWHNGSVTFLKGDFTSDNTNGDKIPPSGATNGASYTVGSLKSELGTTNAIWWASKPFLSGAILTTTPEAFTVTLPSTNPRMTVYAWGKSSCTATLFDMKVPNSIPGFVVPEPAIVLMASGSFAALGLYTVKRRKK